MNLLLTAVLIIAIPYPILVIEGTCIKQGAQESCSYQNKFGFESGGQMLARTASGSNVCYGFVCSANDIPLTNILYVILASYLIAGTVSFFYVKHKVHREEDRYFYGD